MRRISLTFPLLISLMGCQSMLMSSTGDMMSAYTVMHLTPYTMSSADLDMACQIAQSTGNLLLSYERVTDRPDQGTITTLASAAGCAEAAGWEAELVTARALKEGRTNSATDARIVEKRQRHIASRRYKGAYDAAVRLYGEPGSGCSELLKEDGDEGTQHQIAYLIGLVSGVQAVRHDRASGAKVGASPDIGKKVARGTTCLNSERWWGMPQALQAAIWVGLPGGVPEGVDAWAQMKNAAQKGAQSGIRLAMTAYIQALDAAGRTAEVKTAIRAFVEAKKARTGTNWKRWQLLDLQAEQQILALSDRMWTQATGHRTPHGELGTFWDDTAGEVEGEELLDGLDEEEPAAPVEPPPATGDVKQKDTP